MVMSALAVRAGTGTVGDFVMINALMIQLYMPLNFIGSSYREIKQGLIDVEQMFTLLKVNAEIEDKPGAKPLAVRDAEVVFENVNFAYDVERPILRNLSLRVPPGKTVAIVGPSGAGKSTISRLLYRFYDVNSRPHPHRWPGHLGGDAEIAARRHRHGPAGHGAVQRHHPLQHPLRPPRCHRRGGRGGGQAWRRSMTSS